MDKILTAEQKANNSLASMRKAIVYPRKRGESRHGGKRVPAICEMDIKLGEDNLYLRHVGIKKRTNTRIDFQDVTHNDINRYVNHQLKRLLAAREAKDYKLYGRIVKYSLLYSKSFRITAFNRVFDGWGHSLDIKHCFFILKRAQNIIKSFATDLDYRRVYIPKGDTVRPLGVPRSEGRLVMHMVNNFVTMGVRPELEKGNHGFMPGKGTNTCIRDCVQMLETNKYVYEFDLKQFFPSVNISEVTTFLASRSVPTEISHGIDQINRNSPHLPKVVKLEETTTFRHHLEKEEEIDLDHPAFEQLKFLPYKEMMAEDGYTDVRLGMRDQLGLLDQMQVKFNKSPSLTVGKDSKNKVSFTAQHKPLGGLDTPCIGLPQGLNTSPILSLTILIEGVENLKKAGMSILMYADDGFIYSNSPFTPFPPKSIPFNEEKSRGVRTAIEGETFIMEGIREKVKFLGIIIDTEAQTIEGKTREGSDLKLGTKGQNLIELLRYLVTAYKDGDAEKGADDSDLVLLTKSGIHGYVLSRLYQNSGQDKLGEEQEGVHKTKSGLGMRDKCKQHPTRSSEAIPFLGMLVSKSMNLKGRPTKSFYKKQYRLNILKSRIDRQERSSYGPGEHLIIPESVMPRSSYLKTFLNIDKHIVNHMLANKLRKANKNTV